MKKKTKRILLIFSGLVFIILLVFGIKLFLIINNKNIPYRDILDSYNYIYTDIKHDNKTSTIVIEGNSLYSNMCHYMYNDKLSKIKYMFLVDYSMRYDKPIEVNDSLFLILQNDIVDKHVYSKYKDIELVKDKCFDSKGFLKDSLCNTKDEKVIIYMLLLDNITCSRECESGHTYIKNKNEI